MRYLKVFVILVSLIVILPKIASACDCFQAGEARDDREMYNIKHYNTIFAGKLTEIKTDSGILNDAIDFNPREPANWLAYGGIKYTFEVWKQWKGVPVGKTAVIYQNANSFLPAGCTVHFKLNEEYLIYSAAPEDDGTLDIYPAAVCSPTINLSDSNSFIQKRAKQQADLLNLVEKLGFEKVMNDRKKDIDSR